MFSIETISNEPYKVEYIETPKTVIKKIKTPKNLQNLINKINDKLAESITTEKINKKKTIDYTKEEGIINEIEQEEQVENNNLNIEQPSNNQEIENNQYSQEVESITYVIGEPTYYDCQNVRRKPKVSNEIIDGRFTVIIRSGIYNHGGYTIGVSNVNVAGNNAIITVKIGGTESTNRYTQVITCPKITVTFNKLLDSYKVINENGTEYGTETGNYKNIEK